MVLSTVIRAHQCLNNWLIRAQSLEEVELNTQTMVDLTQSLDLVINQEKSELIPTPIHCFHLWATNIT